MRKKAIYQQQMHIIPYAVLTAKHIGAECMRRGGIAGRRLVWEESGVQASTLTSITCTIAESTCSILRLPTFAA